MTRSEQQQSDLSRLAETERHNLLVDWNDTKTDYPTQKCIHQLFEEQVKRTPENVAVIFEDQRLTYAQLNAQSNQLAHYLRRLGVRPETLVGLCIHRSPEMIVGLLGILKAGGAYVPLDPTYPKERLTFLLQNAQASMLLTQQRLLPVLGYDRGARVLCLDTDWTPIAAETDNNPANNTAPENLAYVIYTSGSTGQPKGVQIPHRSVVNFLCAMRQLGLNETDTLLAVTTLSFDIAGLEIYLPLTVGARVQLISREVASDGTLLAQKLSDPRITVIQATPTTWRLLVKAGWRGGNHLKILCGGEALPRKLANQLLSRSSSLWNMYGPTETTIWSLTSKVFSAAGSVPIGRPIANTQVYILDNYLNPLPVGMSGELYIGGDGLARGYLKRPELTAEMFVPNPFSEEPGARLYKTGDLVQYRSDGSLEFLGRIDHQVKIRGFRIEVGEIESVLRQYPLVSESVVIVREDIPGDKRLVAYIVPNQERIPNSNELRHFLKERLPDYLVPSAFVFLDALPLTFNGKLDRKSLPMPDGIGSEAGSFLVAPRDKMELRLTKIWAKILNVRFVGVRDNFFELGGNSLLAARMLTRVEKEFNRTVSLAALFERPTVEELADFLRHRGEPLKWNWLILLQPLGSKPPLFLLHVSRELGNQIDKTRPVYGLRPHGLDGRRAPLSVEEMAADYVTEIRTVQPEGPYFIGGYSLGGLIAFEVAQQLRKHGQEVALLLLLDPTRSNSEVGIIQFGAEIGRLRNGRFGGVRENLKSLPHAVRWRFDKLKYEVKILICRAFLRAGRRVPVALRHFYCIEMGRAAARRYLVGVYPGRVVLLLTKETLENDRFYWSRLVAGDVEVYAMPGEHLDVIQGSYVQSWGQQIRTCLDVKILGYPILLYGSVHDTLF